jgi:hypothetical protein
MTLAATCLSAFFVISSKSRVSGFALCHLNRQAGIVYNVIPILSRRTVYDITGTTPDGVNMRRLKLDWKESEEELKTLYLKEKDTKNRMRLQGLWLLRQGRHIRDVAAAIGCHPRAVQDWIAWYRQGGLAEVLRHRHGGHTSQRCRLSQEKIAKLKQKAAGLSDSTSNFEIA